MSGLLGKHRLPSGFGTIRNLGTGRKRPYAVHPPSQVVNKNNNRVCERPPAICYVSTWETGLKVLVLYHAGLYKKGIETALDRNREVFPEQDEDEALYRYCHKVLNDIDKLRSGKYPGKCSDEDREKINKSDKPTFEEVYQSFYEYRYGDHANKKYTMATKNSTRAAYKRFAPFYQLTLDEITVDDLQTMVNEMADAGYSKSTVTRVVTLAHQIYRYAYPRGLCSKVSGRYVEMPSSKEEEHYQDFTDEELKVLWNHKADPIVQNILIMIYSGFRIGEYEAENFHVFLEGNPEDCGSEPYFQGGIKTSAGRDRVVPIHSAIRPLLKELKGTFFCGKGSRWFREAMKEKLRELGIDGTDRTDRADGTDRYHTPHSCRHTFSRLCESYEVNEADRKRMMGHSLSNDVTNGVYGHRTIKELSEQIEKISVDAAASITDSM